jgi:hypothetical protein
MQTEDLKNQLHYYQTLLNNIEYWSKYGYVKKNVIKIINELKSKI